MNQAELECWLEQEARLTSLWGYCVYRHNPACAQFEAESKAYERVLEYLRSCEREGAVFVNNASATPLVSKPPIAARFEEDHWPR